LNYTSFLCIAILVAARSVFAQTVQPPSPPAAPTLTWAELEKSQAYATEKLAQSPRRKEWVTITKANRKLGAWVIYPNVKGKAPVVLVLHEVWGLTDSTINTGDEIAAMGYVAIVPDMLSGYGPNGGGTRSFPDPKASQTVLDSLEDKDVYPDLEAWADYGRDLSAAAKDGFAMVGMTWGGGAAFRYAVTAPRKDLKAVFVFCVAGPPVYNQGPSHHGKKINDFVVAKTDVPVYGFYGSKDNTPTADSPVQLSLPATRAAMAAAGDIYEPVIYDGAEHSFQRIGELPNATLDNAVAAKQSLLLMQMLLKATFK
jgi:carboxymethylenebutenolidase